MDDIRNIRKHLYQYINSPNTVWIHYNVICSYLRFKNDKRIYKLKKMKLPPIPIKYMPVFSKNYLMNKTNDLTNYKNVIIRFLFETGLRAFELNNIIQINSKTLIVRGKGQKIRQVFIIQILRNILLDLIIQLKH